MAVKNDLKKLRKEQRLKQADLATAIGMCDRSISNIELEKNPASLETALRLAAYFKVHVDDIFHNIYLRCLYCLLSFKLLVNKRTDVFLGESVLIFLQDC